MLKCTCLVSLFHDLLFVSLFESYENYFLNKLALFLLLNFQTLLGHKSTFKLLRNMRNTYWKIDKIGGESRHQLCHSHF